MITKNSRLFGMIGFVAILLMIPLIAMQFTSEVQWSVSDFLIGGTLLLGAVLVVEACLRLLRKRNQRVLAVGFVLLLLMLIWAELAVGLFGTPWAGN